MAGSDEPADAVGRLTRRRAVAPILTVGRPA
jgi:hypothetical protein